MIPYLLVLFLSAAATWLVRRWGRQHLLDHPTARSSHSTPTPRGGGVGVVAGVMLGLLWHHESVVLAMTALVVLVSIVSFADDVRPLSPRVRLTVHTIVAVMAVWLIGTLPPIPVGSSLLLSGRVLLIPLTLLWVIGLTNAYNFMDGIDGIAGLQGVIGGAAWCCIGLQSGNDLVAWSGALVGAASLGFLPLNWSPASIFLGDVGSASMGAYFALMPLIAATGPSGLVHSGLIGALVMWPFLVDTTYTLWRRARRGERLLEAHRSHLYQRLVLAGYTHQQVTIGYGCCAVVSATAAFAVGHEYFWLSAGLALVVAFALIGATHRAEAFNAGRSTATPEGARGD